MEECLICQDPKPVHALLSCLHPVCLRCADDAVKNCELYLLPNFVCPVCCEPSPLSALHTAYQAGPGPETLTPASALLLYDNQEQLTYELSEMELIVGELDGLLGDLTVEQIELAKTLAGHFDRLKDHADAQRVYGHLLQDGVFYYHTDIKATQIQHEDAVSLRTRLRRCLDLINAALADAPLQKDLAVSLDGGERIYSDKALRLRAWASDLLALAQKSVKKPVVTRAHVYLGPRVVNADNVQFCSIAAEFRHRKAPVPFVPGQQRQHAFVRRTHCELGLVYFCEQLTEDTLLVSEEANGVVIYSLGGQPPVFLDTPNARRSCDVQICELRIIWVLAAEACNHWGNALRRFSSKGELLPDARLGRHARWCEEFKLLPGGFVLLATRPQTPADSRLILRLFNARDEQLWADVVAPAAITPAGLLKPFLSEFCSSGQMPLLRDGVIMRDMHDYGTCSAKQDGAEAEWLLPYRDARVFCDSHAQERVCLRKSAHPVPKKCYDSVIRRQQPPIEDGTDAAICDLSGGRYALLAQRRSSGIAPYDPTDNRTNIQILDV